jgi:hypothetical protein
MTADSMACGCPLGAHPGALADVLACARNQETARRAAARATRTRRLRKSGDPRTDRERSRARQERNGQL